MYQGENQNMKWVSTGCYVYAIASLSVFRSLITVSVNPTHRLIQWLFVCKLKNGTCDRGMAVHIGFFKLMVDDRGSSLFLGVHETFDL